MREFHQGFTLIELMVTLAVAAIVVAIAIPNFNTQILNNRSVALGEDFASAINFARVEAVKRKDRVSICASVDGLSCSGGWREGFIVFVDEATSDTAPAPILVGAEILRVWQGQDDRAEVNVTRGAAPINFIRFQRSGFLARIANDPVEINVRFTNCTKESARRITIGLSGLISVTRRPCDE